MTTPPRDRFRLSRRAVIAGALAGTAAGGPALAQWRDGRERTLDYDAPSSPPDLGLDLSPTPACDAGRAEATLRQTEGPYYSPRTPMRSDFSADGEGVPLVLVGRVLTTRCEPLANAVLDVWHADARGIYDNDGYRFRGHLFTDASGAFRLATIRPAGYGYAAAARPPHIHVKAQAPGAGLLTTQLYFPDVDNTADRIFRDRLVMALSEEGGVLTGRFDFVLAPV